MFGYSAPEIIGQPVSRLVPERLRARHEKSFENFFASGESGLIGKKTEQPALRKDGMEFPIELSVATWAVGDRRFFTGIARDITERRRTQEQTRLQLQKITALREINLAVSSNLDLRSVLNVLMEQIQIFLPYAALLVWLTDDETGKLYRAACWNLDEKDWMGRKIPGVPKLVQTAIAERKPVIARNVQTDSRTLDPDLYIRHGLISYLGVPLLAKEKALGVLVFLTREEHDFDADEVDLLSSLASQAAIAIHNSQLYEKNQRQTHELEKAHSPQADFSAMIVHDPRSPLSNIMAIAEMMAEGLFGVVNKDQKKWAGRIRGNARNLVELVGDFLDVSKLEAGKIGLSKNKMDLADLVRNTVENFRPLADEKKIALSCRIAAGVPPVNADGQRLEQVMNNLVSNAMKFTGPSGKGEIRVCRDDEPGLRLEVLDSGVGIPKNEIPQLFHKYRQASSATLSAEKGTGLGLVICKMIVEAHGGKIWVESEEGEGTAIIFTLPTAARVTQGPNAEVPAGATL
jgi:PAS domain S-box-containing protein